MYLKIVPSDAVILLVQASLIALPRALPGPVSERMRRLRGRAWALIPLVSIVGVIFMIRYSSGTADWLTWLALIAVPLLAFAALAFTVRGGWSRARTGTALIVTAGLFVLAWRDSPIPMWHNGAVEVTLGETAGMVLTGLSCVTLGVLLAAVTPPGWLKVGIVLMSCADVWLVASSLLQAPNNALVAAAPGSLAGVRLPQLQSENFGTMNMGYGDFFVAGVLGGILAAERVTPRVQISAAAFTYVIAGLFDLLFLVIRELPATVPVALTVILLELARRRRIAGLRRPGSLAPDPASYPSPIR